MWKLLAHVTCVAILISNTYGYLDYTTYLLSRLTEHVNQVNHLLKVIYKERHYQGQSDSKSNGLDEVEHRYLYDDALKETVTTLKNCYRILMKFKNETSVPSLVGVLSPADGKDFYEYDLDNSKNSKISGRRNASSNNSRNFSKEFYGSLAKAFKKFLAINPDVRNQLGDDFNTDTLINPPDPIESK